MVYPESTSVQLTRPSGSGNLEQNSTGHSNPGFALIGAEKLLGVLNKTDQYYNGRTSQPDEKHRFQELHPDLCKNYPVHTVNFIAAGYDDPVSKCRSYEKNMPF